MNTAPKNAEDGVTGRAASGSNGYAAVLHALKRGPMHIRQLSDATNICYTVLPGLLGRMVNEKSVVVIGTAAQMGLKGVRQDARMFALAGTEKLPALELADDEDQPERRSRPRSKSGSGQLAGPILIGRRMMQYWGRGGAS